MATQIKIHLLDYHGDIKKTETLDLFNGSVFGGFDLGEELKKLTVEEDAGPTSYLEYRPISWKPTRLMVFGEDSLFVLREKISLAFGIPLYRIFLFGDSYFPYRLQNLQGTSINVDPNDLFEHVAKASIYRCVVDDDLVKLSDKVIVVSHETQRIVANNLSVLEELYVCDFADWLTTNWDLISRDTVQREYWYYGFVHKYWPMITIDAMNYLLSGRERQIIEDVPEYGSYSEMLKKQTTQVLQLNKLAEKASARKIFKSLTFSIKEAVVSMRSYQIRINYLNLFNAIRTNNSIPAVVLNDDENQRFFIKKFITAEVFDGASDIKFPARFKTGIVIAVWINLSEHGILTGGQVVGTKQLIFVNVTNQKLFVYTKWREDFMIDYDTQFKIINSFVNPIIRVLNKNFGLYMFNEFLLFEKDRMRYEMMTVTMHWRQVIDDEQFKAVKREFYGLTNTGIVEYNRFSNITTADNLILDFVKGGTVKDPDLITYRVSREGFNYYSWMWLASVRTIWNTLYHGFTFKITHLSDDVRIEVHNISPQSLAVFKNYICAIFGTIDLSDVKRLKSSTKKIVKLSQSDPVLIKFNQDGKRGKMQNYSVICQEKKQPLVYSESDLEHLSEKDRKKLVEYWNFTYHRPTYYRCPSPTYPHLGFQVGKHPAGFCLPCCQKLDPSHKPEYAECMKHDLSTPVEKSGKMSRHIIVFKDVPLEVGRISHVQSLSRYMANPIYCFGVPQNYRTLNHVGLFESILFLLDVTAEEYLKRIKPSIIDINLWRDIEEIFLRKNNLHVFYATFQEFNQIWVEMTAQVYDVNVVTVNPETLQVSTMLSGNKRNFLIIEKSDHVYEPAVEVNLQNYYLAVDSGKVPISTAVSKRYFSPRELGIILAPATIIKQNTTKHLPEKVVGVVVFKGVKFGYIFESELGRFYVPSELTPEYEVDEVPLRVEDLNWSAFVDFMHRARIVVAYGIACKSRVNVIVDRDRRMYFCDIAATDFKDPIQDRWDYPLHEIFEAILIPPNTDIEALEREMKDKLRAYENQESYRQVIFHYVMYLFTMILNQYQNTDVREEIFAIIDKQTGGFNNLKIPRTDINKILAMYNQNYAEIMRGNVRKFKDEVNNYRFAFDEAYIVALRNLPRDQLRNEIIEMLQPYVEYGATQFSTPPIYHSLDFYKRNKMQIYSKSVIDLLITVFTNPLFRRYFTLDSFETFFKSSMKNIDFTKFSIHPGERIEINEMELDLQE